MSGSGAEAERGEESDPESGLGRLLDDSGEFDVEAANAEASSVLNDWRRDDFRTAGERARTLTVLGIGGVIALFLAPTGTSIADSVATAALWTLIPATAVVGTIARTFQEAESAADVLDKDGGLTYAVAITALLASSHAARRGPTGRALWRFLFRSAPFSPDPMPGAGHPGDDEDAPAVTWARRVTAGAVVLLVADTAWVVGRRLLGATRPADLAGYASGLGGFGGDLSTAEGVVLLLAAVIVGGLLGLTLSVRG